MTVDTRASVRIQGGAYVARSVVDGIEHPTPFLAATDFVKAFTGAAQEVAFLRSHQCPTLGCSTTVLHALSGGYCTLCVPLAA